MPETEILERWTPVEQIDHSFVTAEVVSDFPSLFVRLVDGRSNCPDHHDLVFAFANVPAFTVYEEFVHPTQMTTVGREPRISESNSATFPCLRVSNSLWFKALKSELDIHYAGTTHYRLCTMFPVIDVITAAQPIVRWHHRAVTAQNMPQPHWINEDQPPADGSGR